jgi:hypothetical protein
VGYIQPITRLSNADNLAGLLEIQVCPKSLISAIPAPVAGIIYGNIIFNTGGGFAKWEATLEKTRISTQKERTADGSTARNQLPFRIPKDRADLRNMFDLMERDEFIVIIKDGSGKQKIFGTLTRPVQFQYNHDSGDSFDSKNEYECMFYFDGPDNIFFYDGSIGVAPDGAAPAIVKINGNPIAVLAPGEQLNITTDYDYGDFFTITIT